MQGTRKNSKTVQSFQTPRVVDGAVVLGTKDTPVAQTAGCSFDAVSTALTLNVFLTLLGAVAGQRLNVWYTDHNDMGRVWKGTTTAAFDVLFKSYRAGTWGAGLQAAVAQLWNEATGNDAANAQMVQENRWCELCERVEALLGWDHDGELVKDLRLSAALLARKKVETAEYVMNQLAGNCTKVETAANNGAVAVNVSTYGEDAEAMANRIADAQQGNGNGNYTAASVTPDSGWDCMGRESLAGLAGLAPYITYRVNGKLQKQTRC